MEPNNIEDEQQLEKDRIEKERQKYLDEDSKIWQNYTRVSRKIINEAREMWSKNCNVDEVALLITPLGQ